MNTLPKTWTFWLGSLSAAYTAAAGLWATLPPAWVPTLNEPERWVLATVGTLLAGSVVMAHRIEHVRTQTADTDQAGA
jgi:hypothetical protein